MSVKFYVCGKRQISETRLLLFRVDEKYYFTERQRYIRTYMQAKRR